MTIYSIKDLETVSGIKAHTIRIWEQRYGLLEPKRTETNIRYYDDYQLCKLLNVSTLLENGHKVSKIASYSEQEINNQVDGIIKNINSIDSKISVLVNQIISSGITYDEDAFNKSYNLSVSKLGLIPAFTEVIYPMLIRIGLMWNKHEIIPSQEHFISNLIKQKLFSAIESLPDAKEGADSWVLILPEEEDHEIGLLLSYFLLKSKGKKVYYLGQRVPYTSIESFLKEMKPNGMHFFMLKKLTKTKAQKLIDKIEPLTIQVKVCISGNDQIISGLALPKSYNKINSIENFISII